MEPLPQETLEAFCDGDREAFRRVIEHYQQRIFRLGLRILARRMDAEDFTQDVFLRAYEKRGLYDSSRPLEPWLYRLAVNLCRKRFRQPKHREILVDQMPEIEVSATAEQDLISGEERQKVRRALEDLDPKYRMCLALRFESGLPLNDIARALGLPLGTVKSRMQRGLRKYLEIYQGLEENQQ